jgi:hypothetical protein
VLTERDLWRALTCAVEYRQARQRQSLPGPSRWVDETIEALAHALEVSRTRQSDSGNQQHLTHDEKWLTARQASTMIGWGIRRIQRHAHALGAQKIGGRLLFRESAIRENIEGDNT